VIRAASLSVKVSMVWQILLIVVVGVPGAFLATLGYVGALLSIAKHFSGAIKMLIALPVYVLYSVVLVAPLFYMLGQFRPEIQASNLYFAGVLLAWAVVVIPSVVYLGKYRIYELRRAGYFLPSR
tara:strand:- start:125 stop:499 length:375 start_codon:yes stop_codon:yes gene_type:complete